LSALREAAGAALVAAALACAGCDAGKTVVVYSAHAKPILLQYEKAFEAAHPDVDVAWIYLGSQGLLERVRGERHNPQASVWWGTDSTTLDAAAALGFLQPYEPTYATPSLPRDPDDLWTGCFLLPIGLGYHPDRISKAELPRRFADLGEPRFRNRIVLRDPAPSGTMRTFIACMLARSIAETGSEAAGWDLLRRISANVLNYEASPEILFEALERGPAAITVWIITDLVFQRREQGYHFLAAGLDEPVPVLVDGIALVKGPSGSTPEARAFYEFVNTLEALEDLARKHCRIPVREDFDRSRLVEEIRAIPVEPMKVDRKLLLERTPGWIREYEEKIRR
jgi:iron(III) transport system substrate-binding protein